MKSKGDILKVLLDTSFILPTLGIDTGEQVYKGLKKLSSLEAEIYYSRFSILESLWIATRIAKAQGFDMERFSLGLRSLIEGSRYLRVEEGSEIFLEALRLYKLGHRDMIDDILYATSAILDIQLLTLDVELLEFIKGKGLKNTLVDLSQIEIG
ncbi:MAG: PIN domain-containing protein [Candidatus Bathyarchaeia archaeon]